MAKLKDVVNGLTADATPDGAADYLMTYDNSASDVKKVLLNNIPYPFARLSQTILGVAAASIDISSISQSYSTLMLVINGRADAAAANKQVRMRLNNDSGNNYHSQRLSGIATTAAAAEYLGVDYWNTGYIAADSATANYAGSVVIWLPMYTGTTFYKTFNSVAGESSAATTGLTATRAHTGIWLSTTAINRVTIYPADACNFKAGSSLTIYGLL
jgi:hypothetical protein